jgi:hypothetical protein
MSANLLPFWCPMMREVFQFLVSATALLALSQVAVADEPVGGPCVTHGKVGPDYLLKVCEYVVKAKLPVTSHPNSWSIRWIEDGSLSGHAVKVVYLSCCYLGDIAYFDKTNSVLLKYDPGPR